MTVTSRLCAWCWGCFFFRGQFRSMAFDPMVFSYVPCTLLPKTCLRYRACHTYHACMHVAEFYYRHGVRSKVCSEQTRLCMEMTGYIFCCLQCPEYDLKLTTRTGFFISKRLTHFLSRCWMSHSCLHWWFWSKKQAHIWSIKQLFSSPLFLFKTDQIWNFSANHKDTLVITIC